MTDDKRTEREIIAEAYSDEAQLTWLAPVQVGRGGRMFIPWAIHLEAYEAHCKKYGPQTALIDLKDRGCRGGFGTGELDDFIPGWRDRVAMFGKLKAKLVALDWQPIETAPKGNEDDGPFFDVCWKDMGHDYKPVMRRFIDCYRTGNTVKMQHGYPAVTTIFDPQPTHWRPEPEQPE